MKRSSSPSAATSSRLVEPTSVTTVSGPAGRQRLARLVRQRRRPGAAQKTTSAPSQASAIEAAARSRAPSSTARSSVAAVAPVADHLGPEPLPRGEPDRAADQADAEDGDPRCRPAQLRRASMAEAKRSRTVTVSSQSMQASVIDWP